MAGYISPLTVSKLGRLWKGLWGKMWGGGYGQLLENQARQIQQIKLKISLKAKANQPGNGVVIKDGVLKFHENDRRVGYYEAWKVACTIVIPTTKEESLAVSRVKPEIPHSGSE